MDNESAATSSAGSVRTEQADPMQLLGDLQATIARLAEALREQDASYRGLKARYEGVVYEASSQYGPHKNVVESYILVLVDAQSHQFRENYVHAAESGGTKMAALLKSAVTEHLDSKQCDVSSYRTVIRVYANLKKLSVDSTEEYAAKQPGFTQPTFPRCLGGFAAGFSRDDACVDYVDVADDAAVERKICELFKMAIKDSSCQHIFLGASGSAQYVRVLREHLMSTERITLIQRGDEDLCPKILGLPSVNFPKIFEPLETKQAASGDTKEPPKTPKSQQATKYANSTPSNVGSIQKKVSQTHAQLPRSPPAHLAPLPVKGPPGTIPINAAGHRIDLRINAPDKSQWKEYEACIAKRKPCNRFHLGQGCHTERCTYDHDPITSTERYCFRFTQRLLPCRTGGGCRDIYCFRGHICHCVVLKDGKIWRCKMPAEYHGIDRRVERWINPDDEHEEQTENGKSAEPRTESVPNLAMSFGNLIDV